MKPGSNLVYVMHHSFHIFIMQEDTASMRKEIQELRTNAKIFQLSKCTACTFTLDLPAVHFMCMHSFHLRCLGDNEKECPECAPEYRSVLETKRNLEQNAKDQDLFFQQVKNSRDGFSVIAEYFGRGILSKTSIPPAEIAWTGSSWSLLFFCITQRFWLHLVYGVSCEIIEKMLSFIFLFSPSFFLKELLLGVVCAFVNPVWLLIWLFVKPHSSFIEFLTLWSMKFVSKFVGSL